MTSNKKPNTITKNMQPRIEQSEAKKLIGSKMRMSVSHNKTGQLWGGFAPRMKEILNRISEDKISMQIYPTAYFEQFNPHTEFDKWATVAVRDFNHIPKGMKSFFLQEGLYAVFDYTGSSSDHSIFQYIYSVWLPHSNYVIDDRPHFEVLGSRYKNNDPHSQEEIWIPIRMTGVDEVK
ncbi:MAG: GyrI-like domain-containing protein [Bacteroidota bacterium]